MEETNEENKEEYKEIIVNENKIINDLEEFKVLTGKSHAAFATKNKSLERMSEKQQEMCTDEFRKYVSELRKSDQHYFEELKILFESFDNNNISKLRKLLLQTFNVVFKNMRSKTTEVAKIHDNKKIVIGKQGFGIRVNIKARGINEFYDVATIIEHYELVCKGLTDIKLIKYANNLRRMVKIFPDLQELSTELKSTVPTMMLPKENYNWGKDNAPPLIDEIYVDYDGVNFRASNYVCFKYDRTHTTVKDWSNDELIIYTIFRKHLKLIVRDIRTKVEALIKTSTNLKDDLNTEFSRELLFNQI